MDLQAQDRVHRIGQTRPVIIYRLVTANSAEARILAKAATKRKLERLVIHKAKFKGVKDSGVSGLSIEELTEILKVQDGQELPCAARISDNEMERILDRSSEAYEREENENKNEIGIVRAKDNDPTDERNDILARM